MIGAGTLPPRCHRLVLQLGLVALIAGYAGCSTPPHHTAIADWRPMARRVATRVMLPPQYRHLAIGKLTLTKPRRKLQGGQLPVHLQTMRRALGALLSESGAFQSVALSRQTGAPEPRLLLDAELRTASLRRDHARDSFLESFIVWGFGGCVADFYHDHTYRMDLEVIFHLRDRKTRRTVTVVKPRAVTAYARLNFVERRAAVLPFLVTMLMWPHFTFSSSPDDVTGWLAPLALRRPVTALVADLRHLRPAEEMSCVRNNALPEGVLFEVKTTKHPTPSGEVRLKVEFTVGVRPGIGILKQVRVGEVEFRATRPVVTVGPIPAQLDAEEDRPILADLTNGRTIRLGVLRCREVLEHTNPTKRSSGTHRRAKPARRIQPR
ncbi:hypothetical protein ACFL59_07190 [Planctomycetota bacterium]